MRGFWNCSTLVRRTLQVNLYQQKILLRFKKTFVPVQRAQQHKANTQSQKQRSLRVKQHVRDRMCEPCVQSAECRTQAAAWRTESACTGTNVLSQKAYLRFYLRLCLKPRLGP